MDNRFAVNLPELAASSGEYGDVADDAVRIPANVRDKIGDPNLIAGGDQYGALFAGRIAPSIDGTERLSTGVGDGIRNTSKLIMTTHDFYVKANEVATDHASNLSKAIVNP